MSLTPLQPLDPSSPTFRSDVDTFFRSSMPNFVGEANLLAANLNSIAAGGAYAIPYTWGTYGTIGGPAGGLIVQNTGTDQYATDYLLMDIKSASGASVTPLLAEMDDSTSTVRGKLRIVKANDLSKYLIFDIIGPNSGGTYFSSARVSCTASSAVNPFAVGDAVIVFFQRTGDKGDTGSAANLDGPMLHVREELGTGTYPNITSGASRNLNTVKVNTISGASLSSGLVTLPAGTYTFEGYSPLSANGVAHRVGLYNNTAGSMLSYGAAVLMANNSNGDAAVASVRGRFTLSAQSVVSLVPALFGTTSATGGFPMSVGTEVYAELILRKVA